MLRRTFERSEPHPGARTAPGDEAFGGYDDVGERPELGPHMHTESSMPHNGRAGIVQSKAGRMTGSGFLGGDPFGDDQVQTEGMIGRDLTADDEGGT